MIIGLTLGGVSLISQQWNLQAFKNGSFPATVYTRSKRGGKNGSKLITPTFSSYQFVIDFQIVGTSFADLALQRDIFLGILGTVHSAGIQRLIITRSDGGQRYIDVKAIEVTGDLTTDDGTSSFIEVTLEAEYPFLQNITQTSQDVTIFNGGGWALPVGIPFDMSANHSTLISINNLGNYPAYPVFTFIGALTNPSITNNTTGKTLSLAQTLADSTASVIIDSYLGTVLLEPSGNNGRQYVSGDFWTVPVGSSTVTLGNANTTDGGKCVITFKDTFLNV